MKPIGPLMREHRLIERMIALLNKELEGITTGGKVDVKFLVVAIDFMHTYADKTHHGKEEDILFRELAKKQLSKEHEKTMNELLEEHTVGRKIVASLAEANKDYATGNTKSLKDIMSCIRELVKLYPAHIEKEDKYFFYPCLEYLNNQEQKNMLSDFWEFDRKIIHEKYQNSVAEFEHAIKNS